MSITVTEHAIDRYAERILAIDPDTLTDSQRSAIAEMIRNTVGPRVCASVVTLKTHDARFVLSGSTVVTVKPRKCAGNPRSYRSMPRTGAHA